MKENRFRRGVIQIGDDEHLRIEESRNLRECEFEPSEERRIIQGPFGRVFVVPFGRGQGMGDRQPIPVHLEVRGVTEIV